MKRLFLLAMVLAMFISASQAQNTNAQYFLSWDVCPSANTPGFRAEYYSVWISTTGNTPEDFTTMLFDETLSTEHPNWEYENRQVSLDEYANMTVYVAFRHHDITDMDRIVIDNVKLYSVDSDGEEEMVYLFEDFQGGIDDPLGEDWLPEGWVAIDADGDGINWYFGNREGEGAMRSESWNGDPLTPDNWLVTPSVLLGTVGIDQLTEVTVNVFPNPASSILTVSSETQVHQFEVVNLIGSIVLSEQVNSSNLRLDVSSLNHGMYFLRLHTNDGIATRKIQISR
jgi:hypothetical protein